MIKANYSFLNLIIFLLLLVFSMTTINIFQSRSFASNNFYTWEDDKGITHITENPDEIPKKYKSTAKKYNKSKLNIRNKFNDLTNYISINNKIIIYLAAILIFLFLFTKILPRAVTTIRNKISKSQNIKIERAFLRSGIENLDKTAFKSKVMEILAANGFEIFKLDSQVASSIDCIVLKKNKKIAVSINNNKNIISKVFVNEIEKDKQKHHCNHSMLVSSNYFDNEAHEYAKIANCKLIDRTELGKMILKLS